MNLFIDSDILSDAILVREPYNEFAAKILSLLDYDGFMLCSSAHSLLNVYYFTRKIAGKAAASKSVGLLIKKLNIVATTQQTISSALVSNFTDIEDAVQYTIAMESGCDVIITRNIRDYKKSEMPVMTAEQYLKMAFRY